MDVDNGHCRLCGEALRHVVVDLGMTPSANAFRRPGDGPEAVHPLRAHVCHGCFLVQVQAYHTPAELFGEYAYFSSYSDAWCAHSEAFAAAVSARFGLGPRHRVVEIASNDGCLLRRFMARGMPVLGVEPAANVARVAVEEHGVPTLVQFFGEETARRMVADGQGADLLVANNVLAHVPDLHDFVEGLRILLKAEGIVTLEFPHLLRLIEGVQFDTIYHEHFSYLSLATARRVLAEHGLGVFDVEELSIHGGSLRIYARHDGAGSAAVDAVLSKEAGLERLETYAAFAERVEAVKRQLLAFLTAARERGESVAAYGAPAKGNTLLNFCGIGPDLVEYTVDRSPHKQGLLLPGSGIPVHHPRRIGEMRPQWVLILPWNWADEIFGQMAHVRDWGGRFVVPIPELRIVE